MNEISRFRPSGDAAIVAGRGALDELAAVMAEIGAQRALLVVSPSAERSGVADAVRAASGGRIVAVTSAVRRHTPLPTVIGIAAVAADARVDSLVSLGGGTVIDTARLAGLCLAVGVAGVEELRALNVTAEGNPLASLDAARTPHIAIPTTISASEYSDGGAAVDPLSGDKLLFAAPSLSCAAVIVDPELATRTPASAWLAAGARTLDHAVETMLSDAASPFTHACAESAATLLREYLPQVRSAPEDAEARMQTMVAAWLSYRGLASGTLGLSHAIGHQLGAHTGMPHGHTSSVVLPAVVRAVLERYPDRASRLARVLPGDDVGVSLRDFFAALGLPGSLRDAGVVLTPEERGVIAGAVLSDPLAAGYPGGIPAAEEIEDLLGAVA